MTIRLGEFIFRKFQTEDPQFILYESHPDDKHLTNALLVLERRLNRHIETLNLEFQKFLFKIKTIPEFSHSLAPPELEGYCLTNKQSGITWASLSVPTDQPTPTNGTWQRQ